MLGHLQQPAEIAVDSLYHTNLKWGTRKILFHPAGLTFEFNQLDEKISYNHPHFLQPLHTHNGNDIHLSINPGINCPMHEDHPRTYKEFLSDKKDSNAGKTYRALNRHYGLIVTDCKPYNIGFIPQTRFPVIIDLDEQYIKHNPQYKRLRETVYKIKNMLPTNKRGRLDKAWEKSLVLAKPCDFSFQEEFYRPLRIIMKKAWPADKKAPDKKGIEEFFAAAKEFKHAGKLMTKWEDFDYNGTSKVAKAYAGKLQRAKP